ncbi:MAG: succinylglutamate desuccinylase/aspartoacylase family protein [Gammaproteobacteria bacterium]|nr:succinylglutamate desuccinylase/aspartoacylase family protein [Gammaproteobacteria bacterium]
MHDPTGQGHVAKVKKEDHSFSIADEVVPPGTSKTIALPATQFYTNTPVTIPIHIVNGKRPGPRLFVSAAIHGDEINGVEIIRRLMEQPNIKKIKGTLVAIPVVNVHGFVQETRYLPDRRDLNRVFPGSRKGSLAARLAYIFMKEIVEKCTHGIDLHTGAIHRSNMPQIRANLDDEATLAMAKAFSVPVMMNSSLRDGSLREAANELGIPMLLYEAGEALRFDEISIRAGVRGVTRVMREIGMLAKPARPYKDRKKSFIAKGSSWVRAANSGIVNFQVPLGSHVTKGQLLGFIYDPFGEGKTEIDAPFGGIVIGRVNNPLIYEGDALFHIAYFGHVETVAEKLGEFNELMSPEYD